MNPTRHRHELSVSAMVVNARQPNSWHPEGFVYVSVDEWSVLIVSTNGSFERVPNISSTYTGLRLTIPPGCIREIHEPTQT